MKAFGMNVKVEVSDWPTQRKKREDPKAWNIYFTGFGTGPSVGAAAAILDLMPPTELQMSKGDPVLIQHYEDMSTSPRSRSGRPPSRRRRSGSTTRSTPSSSGT